MNALLFHTPEQRRYFDRYIESLSARYGEMVSSLCLFGSMARAENRRNSDCDLLVVLFDEGTPRRGDRVREIVLLEEGLREEEDRCYASGVAMEFSVVMLSRSEARVFNPLYLDMVDHCVILLDRDRFLVEVLDKTRAARERWGSRKAPHGAGWIWDIRPHDKGKRRLTYDL